VVVPRSTEAADEMAAYLVSEETENNVSYLAIETDSLFYDIYNTQLFDDLNLACGALIDDYEEDAILVENLSSAISIVRDHKCRTTKQQISAFLVNLDVLLKVALEAKFPIYFVL